MRCQMEDEFIQQMENDFIPRMEKMLDNEIKHRVKLLKFNKTINGRGRVRSLFNFIYDMNTIYKMLDDNQFMINHLQTRIKEYKEYFLLNKDLKNIKK